MKRLSERNTLITIAALLITAIASINVGKADDEGDNHESLRGRIVALGIPGASEISAFGAFLPGGPIHDIGAEKVWHLSRFVGRLRHVVEAL